MRDFLLNTLAAALGYMAMQFASAWFNAKTGHASYVEEERTQDLNRIIERIDLLKEQGTTYWMRDHTSEDDQLCILITSKMHDLGNLCEELFTGDDSSWKAVETELNRFEDKLTGGHFGQKNKNKDLEVLRGVMENGDSLARCVRRQRKQLKPVWWK